MMTPNLSFQECRLPIDGPRTTILQKPRQRSVMKVANMGSSTISRGQNEGKKGGKILQTLLDMSSVPYATHVPKPVTFLHRIHPILKLMWIVGVLWMVSKSSMTMRGILSSVIALVSIWALPERLWRPQLTRVGFVSMLVFVLTACGSDGARPIVSPRGPELGLEELVVTGAPNYKYTLLNLGVFSVTKRSLSLALTLFSLTFITIQTASLCLVSTAPEKLAHALRQCISPLSLLGIPVNHLHLMLLLSLRFMSTVFEEARNLLLAVAARGIDWSMLGGLGTFNVVIRTATKLFKTLLQRSDSIATAMIARGFEGVTDHEVYVYKDTEIDNSFQTTMVNMMTGIVFLCCVVASLRII